MEMRVIGLMSGTSLDGVDAAWLETDGIDIRRFGPALTLPYDPALRRDLRAILDRATLDGAGGLAADDPALASAVERLTERHAEAVARLGVTADLIGFHGQTILHRPERRRTWQIGDAARLAERTGLPVVHDFRSADVAAGGQGAPLAPILHATLVPALDRALARPVAVLNIGGVANVTWVGPARSGPGEELLAFDAGPGNGPLDDWVARHTGAPFDRDGALAASGRVDAAVLAWLLGHPYFARTGPKSLDRLDFGRTLAASGLDALSPADGAATLVAFTAASVAASSLAGEPSRWLVTGGGRRNPALMRALRERLSAPVEPVEAVGWDGDALEAQCFALLAARVAAGLPITFPGTTGVARPLSGGAIAYPRPPA